MTNKNKLTDCFSINNFEIMKENNLSDVTGGVIIVITGAMVLKGLTAFGGGVALGTLIAKKF